jgi:hypothetical protein
MTAKMQTTPARFTKAAQTTAPAVPAPSIQFVLCVEAGAMETMALRLVQSLRRWGGKFAWSPVLAIKPRFGASIRQSTLREFDRLAVRYCAIKPLHGMSWFTWMNKPACLIAAEASTSVSDTICWLDTDMLILGEPEALALDDAEEFAACPTDRNAGTTGDADRFANYWSELSRQLRLSLDELPFVTTHREQERIRLYFNGGLFVYRRETRFGERFMDSCRRLLVARVKSRDEGITLTDQIALGLTAASMKLRWRSLPWSHNYAVGAKLYKNSLYSVDGIRSAKILHYHDAMWPHFYPQLLSDLQQARPDVADWLRELPALSNDLPLGSRIMSKLLAAHRKRRWRAHEAKCQAF